MGGSIARRTWYCRTHGERGGAEDGGDEEQVLPSTSTSKILFSRSTSTSTGVLLHH